MNVLVIGGGGREHALCWKLRQSPGVGRLWCAPGNAGIAEIADCAALDAADHPAVTRFCVEHAVELVVIGPEGPLVDGLADSVRAAGIRAFGPSAAAARLEGSKRFTKALCARAGIPTAAWRAFADAADAHDYVAAHALPVVIKADGLAAGKGVVVAATYAEALAALDAMAGGPVVVEEFLTGPEASFFVLSDGVTVLPLASAQDHKRLLDGDRGPNTGGMGAYSPAGVLTPELAARALAEIVAPTIAAMADLGTPFEGVLYAGLMLTADGPKLIEYNVRFGDPEAQVLMARLDADLLDLLLATCDGRLADARPAWRDDAALCVVMAAQGYPDAPRRGTEIRGLAAAAATGALVFHAGTVRDADGSLRADGGRVLGVTACAATVSLAAEAAYAGVDKIDWPGGCCRRDIGRQAIDGERA